MSPQARRIIIPLFVGAVALGIGLTVIFGRRGAPPTAPTPAVTTSDVDPTSDLDDAMIPADAASAETAAADAPPALDDLKPLEGLIAVAPAGGIPADDELASLGSFDYHTDRMKIEMAATGAGIERITFSDLWDTARSRRRAESIMAEIAAGTKTIADLPAEARYVLDEAETLAGYTVPVLAVHSILVNGERVSLFGGVWDEIGPGRFRSEIRDSTGRPLLRITRAFRLTGGGYDITLEQRVENVSDEPLSVQWAQYGPGDLTVDRSRYMDRRRFRFGYMWDPQKFADPLVFSNDNALLIERNKVHKQYTKSTRPGVEPEEANKLRTLWPNDTSRDEKYVLSWFASTNRYFGLAVHPVMDTEGGGDRSLEGSVDTIMAQSSGAEIEETTIFTFLYGPTRVLRAGETAAFDMGVYAGPLSQQVLDERQPYIALNMGELILYQMSSFCAICTFQWLADFLHWFLSILDNYVVFDWGISIIVLVILVRTLLHPITKRSQVNMQRFGKKMGELKPEIDRLQKKFGSDPRRMQQEQIRLMREHGINPLQMLGCLPMFLQMPIWVALYAMLYFAFDLRHEPAFFGIFQKFGGWPFLGDLSSGDHFFGELAEPTRFFLWNITGFNILPILMGGIFFVQQKYMSPPPSPTMTKEQLQQQKIMKIMMVVLFPLMLYSAPSGLTLYILTSSCIGVLESRYIRKHVTEMDLNPPKKKTAPKKKKKPRDAQGRAFAAAMDRAKKRGKGATKTYKKRRG